MELGGDKGIAGRTSSNNSRCSDAAVGQRFVNVVQHKASSCGRNATNSDIFRRAHRFPIKGDLVWEGGWVGGGTA